MSSSNRRFNSTVRCDADVVSPELTELGRIIQTLPAAQYPELELAFRRVVNTAICRRQTLDGVQEALSQLRVDIKYLMFDLEVTRRERDQLRQQMED